MLEKELLVKDGLYGAATADILFSQKHGTLNNEITNTKLILTTMRSIYECNGLDSEDLFNYLSKFVQYPTIKEALNNWEHDNYDVVDYGSDSIDMSVSTALTLAIPMIFFLVENPQINAMEEIKEITEITQKHPTSILCTSIYVLFGMYLYKDNSIEEAIEKALTETINNYGSSPRYIEYIISIIQLDLENIREKTKEEVLRKGNEKTNNIINSLYFILWCISSNYNYKDTISASLEFDDDQIATNVGFLAGLLYPQQRIDLKIQQAAEIDYITDRYIQRIYKKKIAEINNKAREEARKSLYLSHSRFFL